MKNKINFIFRTILSFMLLLSFSLLLMDNKTFAASENIYYISTSIGETYDNVGVNYHCNFDNSYVIYSTNSTLENSIKVESTSELWSVDKLDIDSATGFSERYVCSARLENLSPNTKYYYQIVANGEKSDIYTFSTENAKTSKHDIILLADTQSYSDSTFQQSNKVVEMLQTKAPNAKLALIAGDVVDKGGYESQWQSCFKGMTSFKNLIYATVPGNHEYYHYDGSAYIDPSFYNQFFFNPQNGPEGKVNSSYYFKYDNILFIMLDVIGSLNTADPADRADMEAHREWFKQVIENNPSQWIIVGSHAGLISAGNYSSDAKTMSANFKDLFEYYQVDLAFSGHEHIYIRADTRYKNQKNEKLGVTYLVCPATGGKQYPLKDTTFGGPFDEVISKNQNYSGQVMRFDGDKLVVDYYLTDGTLKTSFTLNAKRKAEITPVTNKEVEDSIKFEYNEEDCSVLVSWSDNLYGNAKNVTITGGNPFSLALTSSNYYQHVINNIYQGYKYDFACSITMNDGSIVKKEYVLDIGWDTLSYNISYDLNGGEWQEGTTPPTVYENKNGLTNLPKPVKEKYVFKGWYDENGNKVKGIAADSRRDFNLKAEWFRGEPTKKINYTLNGGKLPDDAPTSYELFVGLDSLPIPTKKGHKFIGWQRNGEYVTSISDEETGNVYLTAVWEKTSGCKKSSSEIMIATLSALSLVALLIRKKH